MNDRWQMVYRGCVITRTRHNWVATRYLENEVVAQLWCDNPAKLREMISEAGF